MELGKRVVTAAVALALAAAPAAAQISYTTAGSFGGSCSGSTCTVGGITIAYNGASQTGVTAPSFISFGTFQTTGSGTSSFSVPFTLTINQTQPSAGGGSFSSGTLNGTLTLSSSTAIFTAVSGEQVQIGTSIYSWFNTQYALVPPSGNSGAGLGVTSLQGQVTSTAPEPASLFLLGTGLLGLGGLRRRRKKS